MIYPCLAAGSAEGLIWLFVVLATIVAQIIKAGKRAQGQRPPSAPRSPGGGPSSASSPNEELTKFLQDLTGISAPEQTRSSPLPLRSPEQAQARATVSAPPRPPAPPPLTMKQARPAAKTRTPVPNAPTEMKAKMGIPVAESTGYDPYAHESALSASEYRAEIMKDIAAATSLKKAILLREVLGPPVAFRT